MINLIGTHSIDQLRLNSYLIINSVRHYAKSSISSKVLGVKINIKKVLIFWILLYRMIVAMNQVGQWPRPLTVQQKEIMASQKS